MAKEAVISNSRLNRYGSPVFDEKDEFAKKIASKWNDGYLKMVRTCSRSIKYGSHRLTTAIHDVLPTICNNRL